MAYRTLVAGSLVFSCFFCSGCRPEAPSRATDPSRVRKVKFPVIADVTLEDFEKRLGSEYSVESGESQNKLIRKLDSGEVYVLADHSPEGQIHSVAAYVLSPRGSTATLDKLSAETAQAVLSAIKPSPSEDVDAHLKIGITKTSMGYGYMFREGALIVSLQGSVALSKDSPIIPYKPDYVQRDIGVQASRGAAAPEPKPIPGSSVKQLEEILDGFSVQAEVGEKQKLYTRTYPTHTAVVHCYLHPSGEVARIEAFVGRIQGDGDIQKLSEQLWKQIAELKYEDSNPQKVIDFIEGPKMEYVVGVGVDVGHARFFLPVGPDGKRLQLNVWETKPKPKF